LRKKDLEEMISKKIGTKTQTEMKRKSKMISKVDIEKIEVEVDHMIDKEMIEGIGVKKDEETILMKKKIERKMIERKDKDHEEVHLIKNLLKLNKDPYLLHQNLLIHLNLLALKKLIKINN
jgi:hypothetical protein